MQNTLKLFILNKKNKFLLENTLQFGTSTGTKKILYIFGGTDGNITPLIDSTINFDQYLPYAFQYLVNPYRGSSQGKIYGENYIMYNFDLFFPIIKGYFKTQTKYEAINNLQLGVFGDFL